MDDFLSRAMVYVKATQRDGEPSVVVAADESSPVLRPVAEGIALAYVVDEPDGLVFIQKRHLLAAGMSDVELHLLAMKNLGQLCADQLQVKKHGLIYGIYLEGNFEASLFVLQSLWKRDLAHLVDRGFAICLPARDILAFCDIDSIEGVATLKQMVDKVFESGDHLLSKNIFKLVKAKL